MDQNLNVSAVPLEQPPTWLKTFFRVCGAGYVFLALMSLAGLVIPLIVGGLFSGTASGGSGTNDISTIFYLLLRGSAISLVVSVVYAYGFFKMRRWIVTCLILGFLNSFLLAVLIAQSLAPGPIIPRIDVSKVIAIVVVAITIAYRKHLKGEYFSIVPVAVVAVCLIYASYIAINFTSKMPSTMINVPEMKFEQLKDVKL